MEATPAPQLDVRNEEPSTTIVVADTTTIKPIPVSQPTTMTIPTMPTVMMTVAQPSTLPQRNFTKNLPIELQNDQKRRSSSRSIKRKRFDDEIVEYSTSFPQSRSGGSGSSDQNRNARQRTSSQTYLPVPQSGLPQLLQPPASVVLPEINTSATSIVTATEAAQNSAASGIVAPTSVVTVAGNVAPTPATGSATLAVTSVPHPTSHTMERSSNNERRRAQRSSNKRSRRSGRTTNQVTTKDLGRWKPIDDLALIIGVQQTNDLRMVHRGVKFSCKFTVQEMQTRWLALLYEPSVSRIAVSAMRNLHPELIESVQRKALFSIQEEELLGTIKSAETPKLEHFQELLDKNASVFYCARTAKSLHNHWMLMKQYNLLPDQSIKPVHSTSDGLLTFSDAEEQIFDADLHEQRDESLDIELALADRQNKREIRVLENELSRWGVLVDSMLGSTASIEFDNQTLACLRGRLVRYLMRSKEITFGRDAKDCVVDVDLSLEGAAAKISRRQGTIKLRSNGDFFISNEGKRAIFIDGTPLLQGNKTRLAHNCTVEMAGLSFAFLVNYELINAIRQESAKTPNPLN